jgi:hypothetical protein
MSHPYSQHEGTQTWRAISSAIDELMENGDLELLAPPEYVTGYLCEKVGSLPADDDPEPFYRHYAALRIMGEALPIEEITERLGLSPTHAHRRGDRRSPRHPAVYRDDMWLYRPPVPSEEEMGEHLDALYEALKPNLDYLRGLKSRWDIDIFCTYTSNSGTAGFQTNPRGLRLAVELDVPLGVSTVFV